MSAAWLRSWWWVLALLACAGGARADVFRPAYLELRELGADRYAVTWKVPALDESVRASAAVLFPDGTIEQAGRHAYYIPGAVVEHWTVQRAGGLNGQTVRIQGIAGSITDVLARVERQDGSSQVERLLADNPGFVVKPAAGRWEVAATYTLLGVRHILEGIDHLLFVLALLLVVRGGKRIVATITAFTVAHSLTLAAATLGWIRVPGAPVEAVIALSIVFVAAEAVHGLGGKPGLTARAPWLVAFTFGLLHGLGFASALAEVGLPHAAIPLALLMFNVGVEIGQLVFVAVVLALMMALRRLAVAMPRWLEYLPPYAIGAVAMMWVVERIGAFGMLG